MNEGILLVTGASGGIGRAIARQAARAGNAVAAHYHSRPAQAERLVAEIKADGGRAIAVGGDLGTDPDVKRVFGEVDEKLGRLTHLAINAGTLGWQGSIETATESALNALWATNITSAFLCAREGVLRMSTRHGGTGGVIVITSSIAARRGGRDGRVQYAASKGALNTFTIGLAKEVATQGVRVNAVLPGFILTEFHEAYGGEARARAVAPTIAMQRVGAPEEVADLALYLLSDKSSFMTGSLVDIAGGS